MSKMHRSDATTEDAVLRKKEQKDVELDKKIIALRKKNEALMRRYHEIEEDRKRAEQEGMAVTSRRARPDGLTITITKAHNEKRIVNEKWGSSGSPAQNFGMVSEEEEDDEEADHLFTFKMGKRVQLAVTMDNKAKGKRVVNEKRGTECLLSPGETPDISEEEMNQLVAFHRGRRMQIAITMDNKGRVDEKRAVERRWSEGDKYSENVLIRKERGKSPQKNPGDKGCSLTGKERSEYMRWKKERDQIDLERLARHKNAKGEWRRAWDIEKSERMFEDAKDGESTLDCPHSKKGGRNTRKSQHRSLPSEGKSGGQHRRSTSESGSRTLPVVSSKARGKDRLTGRARRWDTKDSEEMPLLKDELDNQKPEITEQLKNQHLVSEVAKDPSIQTSSEKNVKHSAFMSQARREGLCLPREEELPTDENAKWGTSQDVSTATSMIENKADPGLSNIITEDDSAPKVNCLKSNSCQEAASKTMQAPGSAFHEASCMAFEDGSGKNVVRNPCEQRTESHTELLVKEEVSSEGKGKEVQTSGLQKQVIAAKEHDAPGCLTQKEESRPPNTEMPDRTNESQGVAQMKNGKQDQPQLSNKTAQD